MPLVLVIASPNAKKKRDILEILSDLPIDLRTLANYPDAPEVVEDGSTFEANARKKAVEMAQFTGPSWVRTAMLVGVLAEDDPESVQDAVLERLYADVVRIRDQDQR